MMIALVVVDEDQVSRSSNALVLNFLHAIPKPSLAHLHESDALVANAL